MTDTRLLQSSIALSLVIFCFYIINLQGKSTHYLPNFKFPRGWCTIHSLKYWSMEEIVVQYVNETFIFTLSPKFCALAIYLWHHDVMWQSGSCSRLIAGRVMVVVATYGEHWLACLPKVCHYELPIQSLITKCSRFCKFVIGNICNSWVTSVPCVTNSTQTWYSANKSLLEAHINICFLLVNTTDLLWPMAIAVNKLAKDFLKRKFEQWYSNEAVPAELQTVNLCTAAVMELSAMWLADRQSMQPITVN